MADDRIHAARGEGVILMGGAINCSFISAHYLLSAYFLTVQTYKHMRLIARVYGSSVCLRAQRTPASSLWLQSAVLES